MTKPNRNSLSIKQALAMLPVGDRVHTFLNGPGILAGTDYPRDKIEEAIRKSTSRHRAGPRAVALRHGLVIECDTSQFSGSLFVETR